MTRHLRARKALQLHRARHPNRGFEKMSWLRFLYRRQQLQPEIGAIDRFTFITSSSI